NGPLNGGGGIVDYTNICTQFGRVLACGGIGRSPEPSAAATGCGESPKMRAYNQRVSRPMDPRWWHRNLTTFQKVVVANSAIIVIGAIIGPLITVNVSGSRLPFLIGLLA